MGFESTDNARPPGHSVANFMGEFFDAIANEEIANMPFDKLIAEDKRGASCSIECCL